MSDKQPRKFIKNNNANVFQDILIYFKLILRLMADGRVNLLIKMIPFIALIYAISPFDFPGPLDDAAILGLAIFGFIELCPKEVVEEHMRALQQQPIPGQWQDIKSSKSTPPEEDVIDGEFTEK